MADKICRYLIVIKRRFHVAFIHYTLKSDRYLRVNYGDTFKHTSVLARNSSKEAGSKSEEGNHASALSTTVLGQTDVTPRIAIETVSMLLRGTSRK